MRESLSYISVIIVIVITTSEVQSSSLMRSNCRVRADHERFTRGTIIHPVCRIIHILARNESITEIIPHRSAYLFVKFLPTVCIAMKFAFRPFSSRNKLRAPKLLVLTASISSAQINTDLHGKKVSFSDLISSVGIQRISSCKRDPDALIFPSTDTIVSILTSCKKHLNAPLTCKRWKNNRPRFIYTY